MDNKQQPQQTSIAMRIAMAAVLTAITAVFTLAVRVPVAPTRGYINLGDVAIYFTAFTFGPVTALIAGGLGTAIADLLAGYAQWAPISFVNHGVQGLAAGLIIQSRIGKRNEAVPGKFDPLTITGVVIAGIVGTVIMVGLYFLAGGFMVGFPAALVEVPGNIIQNVAGVLLGTLLALSVYRAYPPVRRMTW